MCFPRARFQLLARRLEAFASVYVLPRVREYSMVAGQRLLVLPEHRRGRSAGKPSQDSNHLLHTDRIISWPRGKSKHDVLIRRRGAGEVKARGVECTPKVRQ